MAGPLRPAAVFLRLVAHARAPARGRGARALDRGRLAVGERGHGVCGAGLPRVPPRHAAESGQGSTTDGRGEVGDWAQSAISVPNPRESTAISGSEEADSKRQKYRFAGISCLPPGSRVIRVGEVPGSNPWRARFRGLHVCPAGMFTFGADGRPAWWLGWWWGRAGWWRRVLRWSFRSAAGGSAVGCIAGVRRMVAGCRRWRRVVL